MRVAGMDTTPDDRTWTQRFGERCFCGATWGDPRPCGDSRADWTIRRALHALFADRTANCVVCDKAMPQGRKYCYDCAANVARYHNAQDRHRRVIRTCEYCGVQFESRQDKKARFCGSSCVNNNRYHPK